MVDIPDDALNENDDCEESWFAFVRQNDNVGFQIIRVNLSLQSEEVSTADRPIASVVTVPYAGGVDWPDSQDEYDRLEQVEELLLDRVPEGFLFAGVLSAGFSRDFLFFGPRRLEQNQLESDSVSEVLVVDDPNWDLYTTKLLPTRAESRRTQDDEVIRAVSEHGDRNEIVRPVDHYLYFEAATDANRCSVALEDLSPVEVSHRPPMPEDELEDHCLHVVFDQSLDQPAFSEFVLRLEDLAESHNGTYDGWETPLAKLDDGDD